MAFENLERALQQMSVKDIIRFKNSIYSEKSVGYKIGLALMYVLCLIKGGKTEKWSDVRRYLSDANKVLLLIKAASSSSKEV